MDECEVARSKEEIRDNYILLTNSRTAALDKETAGAILNVSSTHQMSQVGISFSLSMVIVAKIFHCVVKYFYSVRE